MNLKGDFFFLFFFMYNIQHCFTCRPSDSTVSEDAGIEPRTVATRRSSHSARSYPQLGQISSTTRLDLIHNGQISSTNKPVTRWSSTWVQPPCIQLLFSSPESSSCIHLSYPAVPSTHVSSSFTQPLFPAPGSTPVSSQFLQSAPISGSFKGTQA